MKLTKLERHMAYMIMLAEAESPSEWYCEDTRIMRLSNDCGLCRMLRVMLDDGSVYHEMDEMLPELYKKLPNAFLGIPIPYNDNGWITRIYLLRQCITETEDAWPK